MNSDHIFRGESLAEIRTQLLTRLIRGKEAESQLRLADTADVKWIRQRVRKVHKDNFSYVINLTRSSAFPTGQLVGESAAEAVWQLVLLAPKECLGDLKNLLMIVQGLGQEISREKIATLSDRISLLENETQRFGMYWMPLIQGNQRVGIAPTGLQNVSGVDELRSQHGLCPLYQEGLQRGGEMKLPVYFPSLYVATVPGLEIDLTPLEPHTEIGLVNFDAVEEPWRGVPEKILQLRATFMSEADQLERVKKELEDLESLGATRRTRELTEELQGNVVRVRRLASHSFQEILEICRSLGFPSDTRVGIQVSLAATQLALLPFTTGDGYLFNPRELQEIATAMRDAPRDKYPKPEAIALYQDRIALRQGHQLFGSVWLHLTDDAGLIPEKVFDCEGIDYRREREALPPWYLHAFYLEQVFSKTAYLPSEYVMSLRKKAVS